MPRNIAMALVFTPYLIFRFSKFSVPQTRPVFTYWTESDHSDYIDACTNTIR